MKKISIVIAALLFSLQCLGQQIEIGRRASINMPKQTKKLNKVELKLFIDSTFGNSPIAIRSAMNSNSDYTYAKDGVLISLSYGDKSLEKDYLAGSKMELDDMFKESKS
jgi:S-adenosylmethionine hydrolase